MIIKHYIRIVKKSGMVVHGESMYVGVDEKKMADVIAKAKAKSIRDEKFEYVVEEADKDIEYLTLDNFIKNCKKEENKIRKSNRKGK